VKVFALPAATRALVFDFDGTLYTNKAYQDFQEDVLVERLARELGEGAPRTRERIARIRAEREAAGQGRTSLGRIFAELGADMGTSIRWRAESIDPGKWLGPDARLDEVLAALAKRFALALVTNNPRSVGEKGLDALGLRPRFRAIVGLDDTMVSKPAPEPFLRAAELLGAPPEACLSIGDRYDVDLAPALGLGMGAILVEGVEDVYRLPELLGCGAGAEINTADAL
jgi:phosphoglycolate phosphatase/putative hydrolase of the HAD superfamily